MRATPKTCLLIFSLQLIIIINAQELLKRVPQGFVGMRGKKYYNDIEQVLKRKPHFFIGVKGKKNIDFDTDYYKRVPMGFVGMRGKKFLTDYDLAAKRASLLGQIDYTSDGEFKDSSTYPLLNQLLDNYMQQLNEESLEKPYENLTTEVDSGEIVDNDIDKRAMHNQFYGVRGKKSIQAKRPFDLSFRGKFIGVRGKKDLGDKFLSDNDEWVKRKGQMSGFFGMRGKKSSEELAPNMDYTN